jgi:nucleoside 2-deoxyribosyltransferase
LSESGSDLPATSELYCFIVYSDPKHVSYINEILSKVDAVLKPNYIPVRLGESIRSTEGYFEKLSSLIDKSVLSIVILDGFRPNVIFEFGYLMARDKPVILLQSSKGCINVKNYYKSHNDAGLGFDQFISLKNPKIKVGEHLSDFAGRHITYFKMEQENIQNSELENILSKEIQQNKSLIAEQFKKITTEEVDDHFVSEYTDIISQLSSYYFDASFMDLELLTGLYDDLRAKCNKKNVGIPYQILDLVGTIYSIVGDRVESRAIKTDSYQKGFTIFEEILKLQTVTEIKSLQSVFYRKQGDIKIKLFNLEPSSETLTEASRIYK